MKIRKVTAFKTADFENAISDLHRLAMLIQSASTTESSKRNDSQPALDRITNYANSIITGLNELRD